MRTGGFFLATFSNRGVGLSSEVLVAALREYMLIACVAG